MNTALPGSACLMCAPVLSEIMLASPHPLCITCSLCRAFACTSDDVFEQVPVTTKTCRCMSWTLQRVQTNTTHKSCVSLLLHNGVLLSTMVPVSLHCSIKTAYSRPQEQHRIFYSLYSQLSGSTSTSMLLKLNLQCTRQYFYLKCMLETPERGLGHWREYDACGTWFHIQGFTILMLMRAGVELRGRQWWPGPPHIEGNNLTKGLLLPH